ncbi:uncharacterized protein LOC114316230 [Camellia sinensis]|uniref:uncharacterized protein LOC114316230 n=1 Tax=Camellia sinensis TaxID=4442 RepID=UPI001035F586|nr:uncharacterized protein LOC114316230 [Camellia sinensis]
MFPATIDEPSTPTENAISTSWSDMVEEEYNSFLNLPDSVVLARNRGEHKNIVEPSVPVRAFDSDIQIPIRDSPSFQRGGVRGGGSYRGGRGGRGDAGGRRSNEPEGQEHRSWANITAASTRSNIKLRYIPPTSFEDSVVVNMPPRTDPLEKWDSCLVGYFVDKGVGYNYLRNSAFGMWKTQGLKEVLTNGDGFMFFIFDTPDSCREVLEGGPWYIGGYLLILKQWKRMMKLSKDKSTKIPVWVKFFNIPLEYWDPDGLSRIASAIGHPLFMDQLTARGSRVAFARICVEIEATSKLPTYFQIRHDDDAVAKLVSMQQTFEENVNAQDEGWTTVIAKGKRKVGEPELETILEVVELPVPGSIVDPVPAPAPEIAPTEVDSSDQSFDTQETSTIKSLSGEEQSSESSDVDRFQKKVFEIAKLVVPNAAEMLDTAIKEVKAEKAIHSSATPSQQVKNRPSGKGSSSQRKKKRGLNDPSKHKEVKKFVLKENIHVMGVLETKIKQSKESSICGKCFDQWSMLSNSQPTETGRVWVCWNNVFCDVQMISMSNQHILCKIIELASNEIFYATFVYAENKHTLRKVFFESMLDISRVKSKVPCVFLGDFNAIRYQQEKIGGTSNWTNDNEEFNTYVNASELADLSYGGCQFTWANNRSEGTYIATKIDRVLVNEAWLDKFPEATAQFLPSGISDHSPAVVNISATKCSFKKPFKYFDFWSQHPEFLGTVSNT